MKTYQEFITESAINYQIIAESFTDLLKFKKRSENHCCIG